MIDSLDLGGAERVAVNLSNELSKKGHKVSLCATRRSGPLRKSLSSHVTFFTLKKRSFFDVLALYHLIRFCDENKIQIIHAHSSSLFLAVLVRLGLPKIKIFWHDHYGAYNLKKRSLLLYRLFTYFTSATFMVNQQLYEWAKSELGLPAKKVYFLSNFIVSDPISEIESPLVLPGESGHRIICVANLRPQKDHLTLIRAMKIIVNKNPTTHLILVGEGNKDDYQRKIIEEINNLDLEHNITWLGVRNDVRQILSLCDIGVLSSVSEGLPLALLEYGLAGLPVAVTNVGQCADVIENGKYGMLVPPELPEKLANSIMNYLDEPLLRLEMGKRFSEHIKTNYNVDTVIKKLEKIYFQILHPSID